ncbi:MAG: HD-GYP domain-containing protein [Burkholderiales bacterium]
MYKKKVAVEDLELGMWVIELDRPWLGTPFDFQGFPITSDEQIEEIKRYCSVVYVDPEREEWTPERRKDALSVLGTTVYHEVTPVEKEVVVAKAIYKSCEEAMQHALDTLRREGEIDPARLTTAVNSMTESIQRNPDAMMLLNTLREKGTYELGRAMDTSILMITFGRFLQYPKERLEVLGVAGMLLDVGKIKLSDNVLRKKDMLSPDEYEEVKAHVMHSVELVRAANGRLPPGVNDIILQHHERQDGSGYPNGLKGDQISIDGSIAALVDSFSALTSARPYAEQAAPSNALSLMHKLRGKLFHEALVEQFIQCIGIYPVGSAVELNTGEVAIVIAQNLVRRLQPRVMVILDSDWNEIHPQKILDLVKEPRASMDEPYRIRRTLPKDKLPIDPAEFFL